LRHIFLCGFREAAEEEKMSSSPSISYLSRVKNVPLMNEINFELREWKKFL
jgi:hypothetical protein